jgi:polysaccharide pyruvyl transferase WcaK-like protein
VIIHVRGTNTRNKGAQLMLESIASKLDGQFELTVVPATIDRAVRDRLDLRQSIGIPALPHLAESAGNFTPTPIKTRYRLTSGRDIDGVLDASGFHYTDQLPVAFSRTEAVAGRAWVKRGVPKVLMPQAFGPFTKTFTRRYAREALEQASLVFVRDRVSENYIKELGITTTTVRSPDFTIGITPPAIDAVSDQPFLAIVPNNKLFTHGGLQRDQYVELLAGYSAAAKAHGLVTVVVVHEETDHRVAQQLGDRIAAPLFYDADPLVLKAALGQASAAVASRFHAVVGCLSQGVPTLALGWSHKYSELLHDFAVPDRLVTAESDPHDAISTLLADGAGTQRQKDQAPKLLHQVEQMWTRTIDTLVGG